MSMPCTCLQKLIFDTVPPFNVYTHYMVLYFQTFIEFVASLYMYMHLMEFIEFVAHLKFCTKGIHMYMHKKIKFGLMQFMELIEFVAHLKIVYQFHVYAF